MPSDPASPASPASVLIVDDNPNNLALLGDLLRGAGYKVRGATDGPQALRISAERVPDLILLDLQMPGMDGYEVCRKLKQETTSSEIPVIVISALDAVGDKVRAFDAGAVDYVTKPFQAPEVLSRVGNHVQLSRLRRELAARNAELERKNRELVEAQRQANHVFSVLASALPGCVLDGKYRLDQKIGAGGFAVVFRAEQLSLRRPVAVKVFRPLSGSDDPEALERFRREGVSTSRFSHPNAVAVLDFGISEAGIAYLVMELLSGITLAELMRPRERLPLARCVEIMLPACEALSEAHAAGIVHRDVKPANIFLHRGARGEVVKVLDFGIARMTGEAEDDTAPVTRGLIGTPHYLAPERVKEEAYDGRSDVYSLGLILYALLCGQPVFAFSREQTLLSMAFTHVSQEPVPLRERAPDLPEAVERLVMRTLVKDPTRRPTAAELALGLRSLG